MNSYTIHHVLAMCAFGTLILQAPLLQAADAKPTTQDICDSLSGEKLYLVASIGVGSSTDAATRLFAEHLKKRFTARGKSIEVIVQNKPGSSGLVAAIDVAQDHKGTATHKVLVAQAPLRTVTPYLEDDTQATYDTKNLKSIGHLTALDYVLVCNKKNMPELNSMTDLMHKYLGKYDVKYATVGTPSFQNILFMDLLTKSGKRDGAREIPHTNPNELLTNLRSGIVDCSFITKPTAMTMLDDPRLVIVGNSGDEDMPLGNGKSAPPLSGVVPGFGKISNWLGLLASKDMPQDAQKCLAREMAAVIKEPDFKQTFEERGFKLKQDPVVGAAFDKFVTEDIARWKPYVDEVNKVLAPNRKKTGEPGKTTQQ